MYFLLKAANCMAEEDIMSLAFLHLVASHTASMQHAYLAGIQQYATHVQLTNCLAMQAILEQESRIAGFKGEVAKSQELHLASLSRDTERLTNSLEKMRAEIK